MLKLKKIELTFNLATVPASFQKQPKEPFDKAYMASLFDLAFEQARSGYKWQVRPPGLTAASR